MRIFILILLALTSVNGVIQLSSDCLKRPEACKNDEFSVAHYLMCDVADTISTEYQSQDGATKGTGLKGTCGFTDTCVFVFPTGDTSLEWTDSDGGTVDVDAGCEKIWLFVNGIGLDPLDANRPYTSDEDALLATKISACKKWLNDTTGVCQQGGGGFIVVLILIIAAALGAIGAGVWFGFLRNPDNQPDWMSKLLKKTKATEEEESKLMGNYKTRVRRQFNDTI